MIRYLSILAVLLAVVAAPRVAGAQEVTGSPMARDLDQRAYSWWGRPMSCDPAHMRTILADFGGSGYDRTSPGCVSYVDRGMWSRAQGWPLTFVLQAQREWICKVWFHKWGHTAWLLHAPGWIMTGSADELDRMTIGACNLFARGAR